MSDLRLQGHKPSALLPPDSRGAAPQKWQDQRQLHNGDDAMSFIRLRRFVLCLLAAAVMTAGSGAHAQIVAFGASNIAGRGVNSSEAFPAQLERMLAARGYNVHIANAGISGDTNAGMLGRLDQAVPDGTKIVLLGAIGGAYNARRLGQGDQKAEYAAIVARLRSRGIRIIQVTGSGIGSNYLQADGTHLTAEGHAALAARLLPSVVRALGH
jgi:acyl-CoA thioesterase I